MKEIFQPPYLQIRGRSHITSAHFWRFLTLPPYSFDVLCERPLNTYMQYTWEAHNQVPILLILKNCCTQFEIMGSIICLFPIIESYFCTSISFHVPIIGIFLGCFGCFDYDFDFAFIHRNNLGKNWVIFAQIS